jgi:PilZ domain
VDTFDSEFLEESNICSPNESLRFSICFRTSPNPAREEVNMKADERRYTPRLKLCIPLRIRELGASAAPAQSSESSDISGRGVYFTTEMPLQVGSPVQVYLRMPEEIAGKQQPEWCCTCRVVRVDRSELSSLVAGVGVEIQYYEELKA